MTQDRAVVVPADALATTSVGDVIQVKGAGVPPQLWGCWFRVESRSGQAMTLSVPYVDKHLMRPFRWQGTGKNSALAQERRSRAHRA